MPITSNLWTATAGEQALSAPLDGDVIADAVIIGGGFTGLSAALHLAESGASVRVVAVTHPEYIARMDEFLCADGACAMLMRGTEGEAYANPRRRPAMKFYADGALAFTVEAQGGGAPPNADVPDQPGVDDNAALIRAMLDGSVPVPPPIRDQVDALARHARRD